MQCVILFLISDVFGEKEVERRSKPPPALRPPSSSSTSTSSMYVCVFVCFPVMYPNRCRYLCTLLLLLTPPIPTDNIAPREPPAAAYAHVKRETHSTMSSGAANCSTTLMDSMPLQTTYTCAAQKKA